MILDHSTKSRWRYVETKMNPADYSSRGINITRYLKNKRWFEEPSFLQQPLQELLTPDTIKLTIDDQDQEVKSIKVNKISMCDDILSTLTSRTTKWVRLKRIVATMFQWKNRRRKIEIDDLRIAELTILRLVQQEAFSEEINMLQKQICAEISPLVKKVSSLHNLNPFLDKEGILRVGGRLSRSEKKEFNLIHPVILPKKSDVKWMIVTNNDTVTNKYNTVDEASRLTKYGEGGIGSLVAIHSCVTSSGNVLRAECYVAKLRCKRWQIYLKTDLKQLFRSQYVVWTILVRSSSKRDGKS